MYSGLVNRFTIKTRLIQVLPLVLAALRLILCLLIIFITVLSQRQASARRDGKTSLLNLSNPSCKNQLVLRVSGRLRLKPASSTTLAESARKVLCSFRGPVKLDALSCSACLRDLSSELRCPGATPQEWTPPLLQDVIKRNVYNTVNIRS